MSDYLARARQLMDHSRYDLAEKELREAMDEHPEDPVLVAELGWCLSELSRTAEAIEMCQRATALDPVDPNGYYALASVLGNAGRPDEGLRAIHEAIRLDPSDARFHSVAACLHVQRHNWREALAAAEMALAIDATDDNALNARAIAFTALGKSEHAMVSSSDAMAVSPLDDQNHAARGYVLLYSGDYVEAEQHFRESLRLGPNYEYPRYGLAVAIKARNCLYRIALRYFTWELRHRFLFHVFLPVACALALLQMRFSAGHPLVQRVGDWLAAAFICLIVLISSAEHFSDAILWGNREGRQVLSADQKLAAAVTVLLLLVFLVSAPMAALAPSTANLGAAGGSTVLIIAARRLWARKNFRQRVRWALILLSSTYLSLAIWSVNLHQLSGHHLMNATLVFIALWHVATGLRLRYVGPSKKP